MHLLAANDILHKDGDVSRDYRLRDALQGVSGQYDYCIIDNAPDLGINVINALMVSDDVLVPVKIDRFAFDGLEVLVDQLEELERVNNRLRLAGCFFTMYQNNNVNTAGDEFLRAQVEYPVMRTRIRSTVKVSESTYAGKPLHLYSPNCTAAKDYIALVDEYMEL
jgi:chromosome partitioning protein